MNLLKEYKQQNDTYHNYFYIIATAVICLSTIGAIIYLAYQ